ncbi:MULTISPECIES: helix-turn-helix domain-containing protein [Aeromonas]|uniref:helix-turn-helix domain-containing protein n=1 Tax=Aeromonas TaxID=642 RepID=UPI0020B14E4D|nr:MULTISPECIES: LysR family transcriptional regulator [Aeromonas]
MINWDDARFFLALARRGSLRQAGLELGVDQATVGRRITLLEQQLGAKLFIRTPRHYRPSPLGEALLPQAEAMAQAALAMMPTRAWGSWKGSFASPPRTPWPRASCCPRSPCCASATPASASSC